VNLLEHEITLLLQLIHHIPQFFFLFLSVKNLLRIMLSVKILVTSIWLKMIRIF